MNFFKIIFFILLFSNFLFADSFNIICPSGWKKNPSAGNNVIYSNGTSSFTVSKDILPQNIKNLDDYIEFVKNKFNQQFKEISYENSKKLLINNHEARELIFVTNMYGVKMKFLIAYVLDNTLVYSLTCCSMLNEFDLRKNDFKSFINSFQL